MTRRASAADIPVGDVQVKRQAETRLREHFSEPLRAQVQAAGLRTRTMHGTQGAGYPSLCEGQPRRSDCV
jgi:hypothetical protein